MTNNKWDIPHQNLVDAGIIDEDGYVEADIDTICKFFIRRAKRIERDTRHTAINIVLKANFKDEDAVDEVCKAIMNL